MYTNSQKAFTLVEIMIVVAIIGILAAIAIPGLKRAMDQSRLKACQANLRQIQGAKVQWALAQRKPDEAVPTDPNLFGDGLYIDRKPECAAGGTYSINAVGGQASCSVSGHTL